MPSLKDLRNRISSVKATQKITSAMKLVAASKLRRAQEQAEAGRPYAERMAGMLTRLAAGVDGGDAPRLMAGTGKDDVHLVLVVTSDRGLCGAFNTAVVREARRLIDRLLSEGKTVRILTVGRKGRDLIRRLHADKLVHSWEDVGRRRLSFADADMVAAKVLQMFEAGEFDVCTLVYNRFKSAISQIPTQQQIVPFALPEGADTGAAETGEARPLYEFEPDEEGILAALLPKNLSIQVYRALLESAASEQGARMTAMDNATRNAGEMIGRLTLTYNRTRQANITKELIEIISGAEAV
jgi:F-type H+-transporting ATPase subunit gamma